MPISAMVDAAMEHTAVLEPLQKEIVLSVDGQQIAGETSQTPESDNPSFGMPRDGITPPFSLEAVSGLSDINATRRAIIDAIARNSVGLGVGAEALHPTPTDNVVERSQTLLEYLDACSMRDSRMERPTFIEHLFMVKTDEESCGQGALEVSRNVTTGRIDGFFYVPGRRVRRLRNRDGYLLTSPDGNPDNATRFCNFGEAVEYDDDGTPTSNRRSDLNELLVFRLHTPENRDYGAPRDLALLPDYMADKLAAEANIGFFDSSGTPPTLVFIGTDEQADGRTVAQGGSVKLKLNSSVTAAIGRTLASDSARQHRVAILPLPPKGKVETVQLGKVSDKDLGFVNFRKDLVGRQLSAFRMSRIFISTDTQAGGRYEAEVERAITLEQVFDPEQVRYEKRIQRLVLTDLGFGDLTLKFKRLAVESDQAKRQGAEAMGITSTITNREFREAHGYGPLPEHDSDNADEAAAAGKVPKGWNDKLVEGGANLKARPSENTPSQQDNRGLKDGQGGRPPSQKPQDNVPQDQGGNA